MLKKLFLKGLRYLTFFKVIRSQHKAVDKKIKYLKEKKIFKSLPTKEENPIVTNYPFYKKSDKKWFDYFYTVYGKADNAVIPLPVYYSVIEPSLNNRLLISSIKDKNFYDMFMPDIETAEVVLRKINGHFYDGNYNSIYLTDELLSSILKDEKKLILKPALFSGSGRSIMKFERKNETLYSDNTILNTLFLEKFGNDFVLQKFIKQNSYFENFNPDSNNTLRVLTYRSVKDDKVHVLHVMLRIGKKGSFLDHDNNGGVTILIHEDNSLNDFACDIYGNHVETFNGIKFSEHEKVPFIEETTEMAKKIATKVFYGRILAQDFTIDPEGNPLLLEINCWGNGISQYQMQNGSVFKEFTKEVLDYCVSNPYYNVLAFPMKIGN